MNYNLSKSEINPEWMIVFQQDNSYVNLNPEGVILLTSPKFQNIRPNIFPIINTLVANLVDAFVGVC